MWTGLAGKPRPALAIQSEKYLLSKTDILALITSTDEVQGALRLPIKADDQNGLMADSYICLDKLMAIPLGKLGERYGKVSDEIMREVDARLIEILGIDIANIKAKQFIAKVGVTRGRQTVILENQIGERSRYLISSNTSLLIRYLALEKPCCYATDCFGFRRLCSASHFRR